MDDNRDRMTDRLDVQVRRSPKYSVFIALGVFVGFVVAGVLSFIPVDTSVLTVEYSRGAAMGILMMVLGIVGAALGAVVALILDRTHARKARTYTVQAEYVSTRPPEPSAEEAVDENAQLGASAVSDADDPVTSADPPPPAGGGETEPGGDSGPENSGEPARGDVGQ